MIRTTARIVTGTVLGLGTAAALAASAVAAPAPTHEGDPTPGAAYEGVVVGAGGVNARTAPTTHAKNLHTIGKTAQLGLSCKVTGPEVAGNSNWYRTTEGEWVSAAYVDNVGAAPKTCPEQSTGVAVGRATADVNERSGPATADRQRGEMKAGDVAQFVCQVPSESVDGNDRWYLREDGAWISARYVENVDGGPATNDTPVEC